MDLELITFPICPFGQRSLITLIHKGAPHRVTYVEPGALPEGFKEASPLGKVPLLRVDGAVGVFESAVINELIDEITPGRLLPEAPLERAQARAWIEFGSACLIQLFQASVAPDEAALEAALEGLREKLGHLEALVEGPYFSGEAVSLVDTTYAPLFLRLALLNDLYGLLPLAGHPKLSAWSAALLALPAVQASTPPDLKGLYLKMFKQRGSALLGRSAAL